MSSFFNADIRTNELRIQGSALNTAGQLEIYDGSASNILVIKAPTTLSASTINITLPTTTTNTNGLLINTGSGVLDFLNATGDVGMGSGAAFTVNAISNTTTVSSAANLALATGKQLVLGTANVGYDANANVLLRGSNQFITQMNGTQLFTATYINNNTFINMGSTSGESGIGLKRTTAGQVQVKPNSSSVWSDMVTNLSNCGDVSFTTLANNNILIYDSATSKWANKGNVFIKGSADSNSLAIIPGTDNKIGLYIDWPASSSIYGYPSALTVSSNSQTRWTAAFNNTKGDNSDSTFIVFTRLGSYTGGISNDSSTTKYNTGSDYRLKSNVVTMTDGLSVIELLKPVTFNWISSGFPGAGFIAHELQTVIPDAVTGDKDAIAPDGTPEYQGIDTSMLVVYLVSAIQQLSARIALLEAKP